MNQPTFNPKAALSVSKTIYFALLAGPVIFFILCLYILNWKIPNGFSLTDPFNFSYIVIFIMVPIIYKYAEKPIVQIKPGAALREKMAAFQTSLIMKVAAWEGIALFSCVVLLQFNYGAAIIFFLISIFGILSNYPSPSKFGLKLGLTQNEIDQF
jgi:hypothetical protein